MGVIFAFSNQSSTVSESKSNMISEFIINAVGRIKHIEISPQVKQKFIKSSRFIVRKSAHFTIYLVLGFLVYVSFKTFGIKKSLLFAILFCFIYACSDEIHQLFVSGRTAKLLDVFIDTSGAFIGCLFSKLIFRKKIKNNQ
jgi:VanZ family protein